MEFYATPPIDGAFCQFVTIDDDMAHPVPDSMSDEAAALLEPLSVAIAAMRKARVSPGSSVLISGAGPIGVICAQAARAFGATAAGIRAVGPAGAVVLVGMGEDDATLPVSYLQWMEITLTGVERYADTWPTAIRLASAGRVDLDHLVTGHYGLEQVAAALDSVADPRSLKSIVRP